MSPFSKKDDVNDAPEQINNEELNKSVIPKLPESSSSAISNNNEKYNIKYIGNKDEFEKI